MKRLICAAVAVVAACAHAAAGAPEKKDRVAIVAAHPDDLIACIGFCLMTTNLFEVHVIDYTHGERGLGPERFKDGSTKRIRTQEESSVCAALGAKLHWLDEIDGEARFFRVPGAARIVNLRFETTSFCRAARSDGAHPMNSSRGFSL